MWVKICGTSNLEDARVAAEAGADALGFIFAPSPRRISPKDAKKIIAELPKGIEKVGVFVNQNGEVIWDTVETVGLTAVQLHGNETVEFVFDLKRRRLNIPVYKAVRVHGALGPEPLTWSEETNARLITALMLDSSASGKRGGSGKRFDWNEAAPWIKMLRRKVNVIIAGGLDPGNVAQAIGLFHPWGVDVVSGVEREPGKKDHEKVRAFVKAAKAAAQA